MCNVLSKLRTLEVFLLRFVFFAGFKLTTPGIPKQRRPLARSANDLKLVTSTG